MDEAGRWLAVLLLGAVEGVTEFLPVSSTGHLIVTSHLLGRSAESDKLFEVVIQLGAIAAVCWHYRDRLVGMAAGWRAPASRRMAANLALAFMPAAICGLLFYSFIKEHLFSPLTVAGALMIGGAVIIWAEKRSAVPRVRDIDSLRPRDALAIGCCQALALFPGVSRAGATIIGAMLWGVERRAATEFSFLLAVPTMLAAGSYDLWRSRDLLTPDLAAEIAAGFAAAFVFALLTVRMLLRYVSARDFTPFGWYRICFGAVVFAVFV